MVSLTTDIVLPLKTEVELALKLLIIETEFVLSNITLPVGVLPSSFNSTSNVFSFTATAKVDPGWPNIFIGLVPPLVGTMLSVKP